MRSSSLFSAKSIAGLILFIFFIALMPAYAQSDIVLLSKEQLITSLDKAIPQLLDSANIPGLSLAVVKDGKILYTQAYGVKNEDTKEKLNISTIFEAASLSKPVFAYACLKFVEEGLLELDKPLYQYLPYKDVGKDLRYKKITARMILSHSSGFPNWRNNDSLRIKFEPGQGFSYSGEGYVYLQKVLEKITGKDLNAIMSEKVFKPLGMKRSSYIWKFNPAQNYASPHGSFKNVMTKFDRHGANAAASLHTTAQDYALFIIAILNSKGLKSQTIVEMLTPCIKVPEKIFDPSSPLSPFLSWGLGFGLQHVQDRNIFWHWGNNYNFQCFSAASREGKIGVIYFTNSTNGFTITKEILKITIGEQQSVNNAIELQDYKSPGFLFKKNILTRGVQKSIEPFLDKNGKLVSIKEGEINESGYDLLTIKKMELAKEVFKINIKANPSSSKVYDSYAEACLVNGEYKLAAENYLKSFELDSNNKKAKYFSDELLYSNSRKGNVNLKLKGYDKAKLVTLIGSFNHWNGVYAFFFRNGDEWNCSINLAPGRYSYKIIIDDEGILDPDNPNVLEENGSKNSVVEVR
jgi:CubicO group peptidase (beta-lactamase class C family)